eukprot:CAMPEP_0196724102 /NCGR_PEP_ID=MMETSP1091-20130531/6106_1 /TAXON_ID=302021 /ORGANISM="Rhodomonas sp., Strain CCMP768" /LENGTH=201 /DNA_ID=CAMNT_0042066197 /DNA_START=55 /DNA_END=660 /DNA_ORIENTATION=-
MATKPQKKHTNPLLIPVEIGKPRPAVVDLPPSDHVYGIKSELDGEGAGAVIGGWVEHQPNAASMPGRDFKKLNRMALNQGQGVTTQQISSFRKRHDARLKGGHESAKQGVSLPSSQDPAFAYGIKSGPRTSMEQLMTNQYLREFQEEQGKKEDQYQMAVRRIPVMHTKASLGHRFVEPIPDQSVPFKMKKFAQVSSKITNK